MGFVCSDGVRNFIVEFFSLMNFSFFSNPNNESDLYLTGMSWPKHDLTDEYYLDIGNNLVPKHGLFLERYSVWDELETVQNTNDSLSTHKINFTFILILNSLLFMYL